MTPSKISAFFVLLLGIEHVWIMIIAMFRWKKSAAMDLAGLESDDAAKTAGLAKFIGAGNGFLAAGLIWGYLSQSNASDIKTFFLACILISGIVGGTAVSRKFYFFQAVPAGLLLLFNWWFDL